MDDNTTPTRSANKTKAEGDRWSSNADTAGQGGQDSGSEGQTPGYSSPADAGGITNRPLDEEDENQAAVPPRGDSRPGAHAGHGDNDRSES